MKFIDLNAQYRQYQTHIDEAIKAVLSHGQFINGPELRELEKQLATYTGATHALGCSSGTTALQIALMALGIQPGDEVITTPFSFFATAEVILLLGATPVYVDIDPATYMLDPSQLEQAITPKTKAIMPVSLYGQLYDFETINAIAAKHGIPVIEDAAQSFGARRGKARSCSVATIACTSFFPSKPLGCYGDGGACFTNDDALADRMRKIIDHGQSARYQHDIIGLNARLDTLQAAILLEKLARFDAEIASRQQVAVWYAEKLCEQVTTPQIPVGSQSVFAQYTIEVDHRTKMSEFLKDKGIPTAVHYPKGLHQQPASQLETQGHFPATEAAANRVLSLPFHPFMREADVAQVAEGIAAWFAR